MGRVIVTEFVSMDGVMEARGGEPGYVHSGFRPRSTRRPGTTPPSCARLGEVRQLKSDLDGAILVAGSWTLVHGLPEQDLVDELRLMVFPVILRSGNRVFPETPEKKVLELIDRSSHLRVDRSDPMLASCPNP